MGRWAILALVLVWPASAAAQLSLEISAAPEVRERLEGQLVDLPIAIASIDRAEASEEELATGDADLCVFVRVDGVLRLGLIDRRASRWLVERRELHDARATVAIETAALTAREWVRELLRGGTLGVVVPTEPDASATASATEPASDPVLDSGASVAPDPASRSPWRVEVSAGWRLGADGSDELAHGPALGASLGRRAWALGVHIAGSFRQRWNLTEATIARAGANFAAEFQLRKIWARGALMGRARAGAALRWRTTRQAREGLVAEPRSVAGAPFVGLRVGAAIRLTSMLSVALWGGADVWLSRPRYEVEDGAQARPWRLQPALELSFHGSWEVP
ncbi:MAG: hypothetical protein AAGE52_17965 [Myxococcota bacterium]